MGVGRKYRECLHKIGGLGPLCQLCLQFKKNVKNTHEEVVLLVKLQAEAWENQK